MTWVLHISRHAFGVFSLAARLGIAGSEVIVNNPFLLIVAEQQLESL